MDISTASLNLVPADYVAASGLVFPFEGGPLSARPSGPPDPEYLRQTGWEIGERRHGDGFTPTHNHVGLGMVPPTRGFAHWRMLHSWVDQVARSRGNAWEGSRPILRLYDVTCIDFNGLNAHRMQDES